jgi:hypothetical protein
MQSDRPILRAVPWCPFEAPAETVYNVRTTGIRERLIKADGTSADPHARLASARIRRAQVEMEWRESLRVLVKIDELIDALELECETHDTIRPLGP